MPPNTLAELKRDMERRRLVRNQIREIEKTRLERIEQAPSDGPHVMVRLLARVIGVGVETADMLVQEVLSETCVTVERWRAMVVSPARLTRAARSVARKGWLDPVTRGSGAA